jgi:hypothetical protein
VAALVSDKQADNDWVFGNIGLADRIALAKLGSLAEDSDEDEE